MRLNVMLVWGHIRNLRLDCQMGPTFNQNRKLDAGNP